MQTALSSFVYPVSMKLVEFGSPSILERFENVAVNHSNLPHS